MDVLLLAAGGVSGVGPPKECQGEKSARKKVLEIQRSHKRFVNLVKQDPGRARQNR